MIPAAVDLLTPTELRKIENEMRTTNMFDRTKFGKAVVVNEAHGLHKDTIRLFLDVWEPTRIPKHACWIFTTSNVHGKFGHDSPDAAAFLSRCDQVRLSNNETTREAFAIRARQIAELAGKSDGLSLPMICALVEKCQGNFRDVLRTINGGSSGVREALANIEKQPPAEPETPARKRRRKEAVK
jgi:hypothetical protein